MRLYRETTDGSTIEDRETVLVWNYEDADPDFGSCQAKELVDHLESVLANEPVSVKTTPHSVEVKPQVTPPPRSSKIIFTSSTCMFLAQIIEAWAIKLTRGKKSFRFLVAGREQGPGGAAHAGVDAGAGRVPGLRAVHRRRQVR